MVLDINPRRLLISLFFCLSQCQTISSLVDCGAAAISCGFENSLFCSFNHTEFTIESTGTESWRGTSGPNSGSYFANFNSDIDGEIVTSPKLKGQTGSIISFAYQMYGSTNMGTLTMSVYNTDNQTWIKAFSKDGNQGRNWKYSSYTTYYNFSHIKFNGVKDSGSSNDLSIDDLNIDLPPCEPSFPPTFYPTPMPSSSPTVGCGLGQIFVDNTCSDCPIGKFTNRTSILPPYPTECLLCEAGYYASSPGNYECTACATGKLSSPTRTAWYVVCVLFVVLFIYFYFLCTIDFSNP